MRIGLADGSPDAIACSMIGLKRLVGKRTSVRLQLGQQQVQLLAALSKAYFSRKLITLCASTTTLIHQREAVCMRDLSATTDMCTFTYAASSV